MLTGNNGLELDEDRRLTRENALPSLREWEPSGAIHLGYLLYPARPPRPLNPNGIALECFRIPVRLHGPGLDHFAGPLSDGTEREKIPADSDAEFLGDFASSGRQWILARRQFALGNRPRALVPVSPEWTARMNEEDL